VAEDEWGAGGPAAEWQQDQAVAASAPAVDIRLRTKWVSHAIRSAVPSAVPR